MELKPLLTSRYQLILGNTSLQLLDARSTLVPVAMSCPSAHSQNFSPKRFDTDGHPTGLAPSTTCLTAYNGSPIRQFGTFRTHIDWTPQGKQTTNCLHTQWYVADIPGPGNTWNSHMQQTWNCRAQLCC